mgnify:FL=1
MSGPKSSRYTLTPEQRRILAEQRAIERRKSVALESIKRNNKRLLQIGSMFTSAKDVSGELLSRCGNDGGFASKLLELENVIAPIAPIISKTNNDDVISLESTSKEVAASLIKAEKIASELSAISAKNEIALHASLSADIDKGFSTSFADIQTLSQTTISEIKSKIRSQLIEMKNNQNLPKELVGELDATLSKVDSIDNEAFLKNYSSVTVSPLIKRCRQYLNEYEACHEEFEKLYAEYIALCDLYYYVAQEYPCCNASIEALKTEIKRIKDTVDADDEQAYISDCLDEVMEEMGYTVIGSREVTKKNGKRFRNELYTYGEGTAVNVTYSSDGKIAMELGGIDATDRLPDSHETAVLCESMENFCEDFKEIEKRLLAKGVVLADRISLLPPSAEYAQIINTADYRMTEKAETLQTKKQRRTATKRKALRKE